MPRNAGIKEKTDYFSVVYTTIYTAVCNTVYTTVVVNNKFKNQVFLFRQVLLVKPIVIFL